MWELWSRIRKKIAAHPHKIRLNVNLVGYGIPVSCIQVRWNYYTIALSIRMSIYRSYTNCIIQSRDDIAAHENIIYSCEIGIFMGKPNHALKTKFVNLFFK